MSQTYSSPARALVPGTLPDLEVWQSEYTFCPQCEALVIYDADECGAWACPECETVGLADQADLDGWFYWFCFPGCLPEGEPVGPFDTQAKALADARSWTRPSMITTIISGGQTGADQGGLAAALALGLDTGGVCPAGWRTERGADPSLAALGVTCHPSADYPPRTRANVAQADGTVWFGATLSVGYRCTWQAALAAHKPFLANPSLRSFRAWVETQRIRVLNVAGNRESKNPGIFERTREFLIEALAQED